MIEFYTPQGRRGFRVLDKGYVILADAMGSDLSVVNAARVSYNKESTEYNEKDAKLVDFLAREGHTAPFRHAALSFEVYAPLLVARQWWKYAVGSTHIDDMNGWNESSRRYVTEEPEFYVPSEWRGKPENSKQGSAGLVEHQESWSMDMLDIIHDAMAVYQQALDAGMAPEQARLFLPAYAMYVRWRWTVSLQAVLHFLKERLGHDAQREIQEYAAAVAAHLRGEFPESVRAWGI